MWPGAEAPPVQCDPRPMRHQQSYPVAQLHQMVPSVASWWGRPVRTAIAFVRVYSCNAANPFSRPNPDFLHPPNGSSTPPIRCHPGRRQPDGSAQPRGNRLGIYDMGDTLDPADPRTATLYAYAAQVADAVGIRNASGHAEVILTSEGPRLVEIAGRFSGGCMQFH